MKKTALLVLLPLMLAATPSSLFAQANDNQNQSQTDQEEDKDEEEETTAEEGEGSKRFWQATVPGGNYMVAIDRISSVSMHEYVLDALLVNEVVIDTNGRALARFYHIGTIADAAASSTGSRVVERGRQLVDQAGQRANTNIHNLPQKSYPTTTHAGMIEYRILNLADLKALYKNVQSAWESGRGKTITVR